MKLSRWLAGGALIFASAHAQTPSGKVGDIEYLFGRIERSGCGFVRNGTAHPANDAVAHLRKKLEAAQRNLTIEEFIDHIAAKSSMSGQPYFVRCQGAADEPSAVWLRRALAERK